MIGEEEYYNNIKKMVDLTEAGTIEWTRSNPTTYYYRRSDKNKNRVNISVQRIGKARDTLPSNERYQVRFQIIRMSDRHVVLSFDSDDSKSISNILRKLYEVVSYSVEKRSIDYFNDLLDDL